MQSLTGIFELRVSPVKLRFEFPCCLACSAQLADQARVVLVELRQFALLDGDCLIQGTDLRLELLDLLLMPTLILIPLLFHRFTIMLQCLSAEIGRASCR